MAAIKINFHVSFRVIVPMLQHRPFQNIKTDGNETDGNEFKMFYKNNVIYWLIHIDFQIQEIFLSRLENPINKLVLRTRLFIGFATLSGNISCALVCLSDLQLSREIFPVSESQCELISISKSYELMVLALCVLSNVG